MSFVQYKRRPLLLNEETHQALLTAIKKNLPYEMCAWYAKISTTTFSRWMSRGRLHNKQGIKSEYARLVEEIQHAESLKVASHLESMEKNKKGWKARLKILEKRWHKFFGKDVATIEDIVKKIEGLNKIGKKLNRIQGVDDYGREMDTESNQEERCVEKNLGSEEGQENHGETAQESRTFKEPENPKES